MNTKITHGGARTGAGAKKKLIKKITTTIRVTPDEKQVVEIYRTFTKQLS